jgi:hypothetical protein
MIPLPGSPNLGLSLTYLATTGVALRCATGALRSTASNPMINPNPISDREKDKAWLERTATESFGTVGGFITTHAVSDFTGKCLAKLFPQSHPQSFLGTLKSQNHEDEAVLESLKKAFLKLYSVDADTFENKRFNVLSEHVFGGVSFSKLQGEVGKLVKQGEPGAQRLLEALKQPATGHPATPIAREILQHFKQMNKLGGAVVVSGVLANLLYSGLAWQALLQGPVRKQWIPKLLTLVKGPEKPDRFAKGQPAAMTVASLEQAGARLNPNTVSKVSPLPSPASQTPVAPPSTFSTTQSTPSLLANTAMLSNASLSLGPSSPTTTFGAGNAPFTGTYSSGNSPQALWPLLPPMKPFSGALSGGQLS